MTRTRTSIRILGIGFVTIATAILASPVLAETRFGVRTGVYVDDSAGFLGGEIVTAIAPNWYFNPNLEAALNGDRDVITVNGDFHYDFFQDRPYWVWAGAGPAYIHREEGDQDAFGVNLLGGIGWKTRSKVSPYVQGKVTLSNDDEAVLAVGMRF
ncbi:MAG TPA: hypothetical protein VFV19_18080 [Candidatus Polarisedimenticolaceae bacterium]|nr:hypothetical protein [Candidatus Polarisedimenticolaceae bacterium]